MYTENWELNFMKGVEAGVNLNSRGVRKDLGGKRERNRGGGYKRPKVIFQICN